MILQVCECSFEPHVLLVATYGRRLGSIEELRAKAAAGKSHSLPRHHLCATFEMRWNTYERAGRSATECHQPREEKSRILLWTASDSSIEQSVGPRQTTLPVAPIRSRNWMNNANYDKAVAAALP